MYIDAKLRPLYLLQILTERTDEDNYLTTTQLCNILKQSYGMEVHLTTIKSNLEIAELKTIIYAIASSKFIIEKKR